MDLYTMTKLSEMRMDDLRREASLHNASAGLRPRAPIAAVRRATGSMMVRAGARLLGGGTTVTVEACDAC